MRLTKLFNEDSGNQNPDPQAIIGVLERAVWQIRLLKGEPYIVPVNEEGIKNLAAWVRARTFPTVKPLVKEEDTLLTTEISRYTHGENHELVEPLKREYYSHLDIPGLYDDDEGEFHTDDKFEEPDWQVLGFEFYLSHLTRIGAVADLADTTEEIVVPLEVMEWMNNKRKSVVAAINAVLSQL